ncbi:hypothetical protein QC762_401337 [Podospora pseudocomata]|uniref:Uncharacterized protein n=1 Tax=Podospora pseudocomata TaxID=2093779 RepID=A0ABR0GEH6_9PEZI|nr:hypothetical protein QC762_401337 [Podospora pseudocomata]
MHNTIVALQSRKKVDGSQGPCSQHLFSGLEDWQLVSKFMSHNNTKQLLTDVPNSQAALSTQLLWSKVIALSLSPGPLNKSPSQPLFNQLDPFESLPSFIPIPLHHQLKLTTNYTPSIRTNKSTTHNNKPKWTPTSPTPPSPPKTRRRENSPLRLLLLLLLLLLFLLPTTTKILAQPTTTPTKPPTSALITIPHHLHPPSMLYPPKRRRRTRRTAFQQRWGFG